MKVIVKPHKIKIELEHDYNSGEYNVQECNFEFSDEYTGLSKVVIFSNSNVTKEIQIYDDKCIVPAEVLQNEGVVGIGVYGYEVSGDDLILRYSPKPQCFSVEKGSYAEGTQPTPPTPSVVEQLQQQITNNANNISSLQDLTASQGEQIETNANDISAIKSEQTTQNNKIQANTEEIESINGIIPTLAKKTEIPTKVSQLENDSNYVTETEMSNAINEEKTERENADIELQSQIDAMTVSSDVVDVVGTYQELLDYDTSKLTDDDIIKVLMDSTHNDALSYYRWQITGGIGSWQYVGSEGPFYTKSETDSLLNEKQDEITNDNKLDSDLVSDDSQTNKFVTVQEKNTWNNKQDALDFDNTPTENSNNPVKSGGIYDFVNTKLEDYVLETDFEESQSLQDDEIARNKMIYNAMPKVSGEGTDLTLDNTAECPVCDIELSPSELEQETTSGKNLAPSIIFNKQWSLSGSGDTRTIITSTYKKCEVVKVSPNTTYTISGDFSSLDGNVIRIAMFDNEPAVNSVSTKFVYSASPYTFTTQSTTNYILLYNSSNTDTTVNNLQVEIGDTATSYEPYTYGASPNPQYPQEIHTVSGENTINIECNLFDTEWEQGEIRATGVEASATTIIRTKGYIPVIPNQHYAINRNIATSYIQVRCYGKDKNYLGTGNGFITTIEGSSNARPMNTNDKQCVIAPKEDVYYLRFNDLSNNLSTKYMMTKGDTQYSYQPYTIQSLPLSLGDLEYCKIGDYEDLFFKNVVGSTYYDSTLELDKWYLKKNIGKVVLNGSELGWQLSGGTTNVFQNNTYFNGIYLIQKAFCNYYTNVVNSSITANNRADELLTNGQFAFRDGITKDRIYFKDTRYTSIDDFKNFLLTNTPILYFVLATPTYTLLNDTLQTQLDNIQKAITYQDQTNVSQTNNDLPFVIKLSAIRDLSGIFELIQ